jgi:hypothetical protein
MVSKSQKNNNTTKYLLGFDISTSCIGISIFTSDKEFVEVNHIKFKTDKDILPEHRTLAKGKIFKEYIQKYKILDIEEIFIEEPLSMSNNQYTNNLLQKFNGICSYILFEELSVIPKYKSVHEIRLNICPELVKYDKKGGKHISFPKDVDKKEYIFNKIKAKYENIPWLLDKKGNYCKENYDMSDSIAVTLSFLDEI